MPTSRKQPAGKSVQQRGSAVARALLGRALGFRDCRADTLDALVARGRLREMGKGEVLAQRGTPSDALCLVVEGSVEVSLLRADGHRHLTNYLQPGDLAGIIGVIDGLGPTHDLRARVAATVVLTMPGDEIRQLRDADPMLGRAFEVQLAFRSRLLHERLAADPSISLETRLARLLQILAGLYGHKRPEGVLLAMRISQADLGDWLGVSRQRANFAIQQLTKDGLIRQRYSAITIVDAEALARRTQ